MGGGGFSITPEEPYGPCNFTCPCDSPCAASHPETINVDIISESLIQGLETASYMKEYMNTHPTSTMLVSNKKSQLGQGLPFGKLEPAQSCVSML